MLNNEGNEIKFGILKETLSEMQDRLEEIEKHTAGNGVQGGATPMEEVASRIVGK